MNIRSDDKRDEKGREKKWEEGRRSKRKRVGGGREKTKEEKGREKRKQERN